MAFAIHSRCINCAACEPACLSAAIFQGGDHYVIDTAVCNHCAGLFATPQCIDVCPVDAIVTACSDTPAANVKEQKKLALKRRRQEDKNKAGPQIARISQPFGAEDPLVHCPICGHRAIQVIDGVRQASPCPHLAFVFIDEFAEFEYLSPDFKKRTADFRNRNLDTGKIIGDGDEDGGGRFLCVADFPALLKEADYDANLLVLEITYGNKAVRHLMTTDVYGYDYDSLRKRTMTPTEKYDIA